MLFRSPQGLYQITAKTSDTVVTIAVPSAYTNESAVSMKVWNKLFQGMSSSITSATATEYLGSTTQPSYAINTTTELGVIIFGTTTVNRNLTVYINDTVQSSHFNTPLVTLHANLAGLQGGSAGEYFHLTSAEYVALHDVSAQLVSINDRISTVKDTVSNEISVRAAASAALESHINTVSNSLSAEIANRTSADNAVSAAAAAAINTVSAQLASVDTKLSTAISNEISARQAASAALEKIGRAHV